MPETWYKIKGVNNFAKVVSNLAEYRKNALDESQISLKYIVLPGINDSNENYCAIIELMNELQIKKLTISRNLSVKYSVNDKQRDDLLFAVGSFVELLHKNNIDIDITTFYSLEERALIRNIVEKLSSDFNYHKTEMVTTSDNSFAQSANIYSLLEDSYIQNLQIDVDNCDTIFDGSLILTDAGTPSYTIVSNPLGGNAIRVANRTENKNGIDIMIPNLNLNLSDGAFLLVIQGFINGGGGVLVSGGGYPWTTLDTVQTDGEFILQVEINTNTVQNMGSRQWLRICTERGNINDFTIYNIVIAKKQAV